MKLFKLKLVLFVIIGIFSSMESSPGSSSVESVSGVCPGCMQKVLKMNSDMESLIRHYREEITRLMKALNDALISNNHEVGYWMDKAISCANKFMGKARAC